MNLATLRGVGEVAEENKSMWPVVIAGVVIVGGLFWLFKELSK